MKDYLEKYFEVLLIFYNANRLKINPDKTQLCINAPKKLIPEFKEFRFKVENYYIKNKPKIKLLGTYVNYNLTIDNHLNNVISKCYNVALNLKKVIPYTDEPTWRSFANGHIISRLNYMCLSLNSARAVQVQRLHKLIMYVARLVIGDYCFKKSTNYILDRVGWLSARDFINWSTIKFMHKIIQNQRPLSIYNYYKINKRKGAEIRPVTFPKSKYAREIGIYKGLQIYNRFPYSITDNPHRKFKNKGLKYFKQNFKTG